MTIIPTLAHKHIFGLNADVMDNIWFVDENLIVYPVGHTVVVYNCETRLQSFVHGTEGDMLISDAPALHAQPVKSTLMLPARERREHSLPTHGSRA